jgi:cob(I)alamin adenosyltransferase
MNGLIHIYTGDGKGKTTAAIGLSIRMAGSGGKVIFTQFLKDNKSSELALLSKLPLIQFIPVPKSFGFYKYLSPLEQNEAKEVYTQLLKDVLDRAAMGDCQLLVLDEVIAAYNHQLIPKDCLLDFLRNKPQSLEIVMTGRCAAEELIELADYVSEIMKVKHPYDSGIEARVGVEK